MFSQNDSPSSNYSQEYADCSLFKSLVTQATTRNISQGEWMTGMIKRELERGIQTAKGAKFARRMALAEGQKYKQQV